MKVCSLIYKSRSQWFIILEWAMAIKSETNLRMKLWVERLPWGCVGNVNIQISVTSKQNSIFENDQNNPYFIVVWETCIRSTIYPYFLENLQLQNQSVQLILNVLRTLPASSRNVKTLVSLQNVVSMLSVKPATTELCAFAELVILEIHTAFVKSVR